MNFKIRQDVAVALAAIEELRGNRKFAEDLLTAWPSFVLKPTYSSYDVPITSIESRVVCLAISHWIFEAVRPGTDRRQCIQQLEKLRRDHPAFFAIEEEQFLKRLKQSVEERYAGDDPYEKLVDRLCDCSHVIWEGSFDRSITGGGRTFHLPVTDDILEIVEKGFDMAPTLLRHLNDERLTMAEGHTVGETCACLLGLYGGGRPVYSARPDRIADLLEWWRVAQQLGEEEMSWRCLVEHAKFPYWSYGIPLAEFKTDHSGALVYLLLRRYPEGLLIAIDRLLDMPNELRMSTLFEAARLSRSLDMSAVVDKALWHAELDNVACALAILFDEDQARYESRVQEILSTFPTQLKSKGVGPFALVASWSSSPETWRLRKVATDRAETGLRLLLVSEIANLRVAEKSLAIQYLASYLNDPARLDIDEEDVYDWEVHYGCDLMSPVIGNQAAFGLSRFFGIEEPEYGASDEIWSEFRARMRAEVDRG
jgi:hypothetical protein